MICSLLMICIQCTHSYCHHIRTFVWEQKQTIVFCISSRPIRSPCWRAWTTWTCSGCTRPSVMANAPWFPADKTGPGLACFGNMKRWRALWNFQKKMGRFWKMNVSFAVGCSWKDFANQFWHQFEYEVNHVYCGLLHWTLCSALLFGLDMIAKTTMCFNRRITLVKV